MQAGVGRLDSEIFAEQTIEFFEKEIASIGVEFPHLLDVTEEKPFGDKSREGRLVDGRGMLVHDRANLDHWFDQLFRREQVAQAQRGTKNLAHRAGVNYPAGIIEPL